MVSAHPSFDTKQVNTTLPVVVLCPGYHGHSIARSLGRLGTPLYGVYADPHAPAKRSRYWKKTFIWDFAKADEEESVAWLLGLARKLVPRPGVRPLLLATDDDSCVFIADHASALREGFLFPEQPEGLVRSLSNKKQMYFLCKQHG